MSWQNSLKILNDEAIGGNLAHLDSRTSSVTVSWGVYGSETNSKGEALASASCVSRNGRIPVLKSKLHLQ